MEGLAAEWAARECYSFLAATPQLLAGPLTQSYGEWKLSCVLTEWRDRTLKLGYSLQFCSVPPPFRGLREANLSSQEEIGFVSTEIQALLQKQAVSVVHSQDREKGLYSMYFLVPKKTGEFRPILDLRSLNQHIACKKFHM